MITTCPVCKSETLSNNEQEPGLLCNKCGECGGVFISAEQYNQWLRAHGANLPEKPAQEQVELVSGETVGAKFCPQCRFMLMKYKVGHNVNFSLNRCGHCGGMWFDKNEWEILKSRNLHDDVHMVFSHSWQSKVRDDERVAFLDAALRKELGEEDFNEVRRIKGWMDSHPKSAQLFAFLMRK